MVSHSYAATMLNSLNQTQPQVQVRKLQRLGVTVDIANRLGRSLPPGRQYKSNTLTWLLIFKYHMSCEL
jgi:hypothetical protein